MVHGIIFSVLAIAVTGRALWTADWLSLAVTMAVPPLFAKNR